MFVYEIIVITFVCVKVLIEAVSEIENPFSVCSLSPVLAMNYLLFNVMSKMIIKVIKDIE